MKLLATRRFPYSGKMINAGELFDAADGYAKLLVHIRAAEYLTVALKPEKVAPDPDKPKKKRKYKRRDLTAENIEDSPTD